MAAALEAGIVWVNCSQPCFCQAPWGGTKDSGFGRELGPFGLESFLSVKQVRRGGAGHSNHTGHSMRGGRDGLACMPCAPRAARARSLLPPPAPHPRPQITTYTSPDKWGWFPERSASPRL